MKEQLFSAKFLPPVLDIKSLADDGSISGYGSIFGNKDLGGQIVVAGAFAESLAEHRRKGTSVKMFWHHDMYEPIGKWTDISEDGKGLFVEGKLNMGVRRAQEAHALLKSGDIDGLSIGYRTVDAEPDEKRGVLLLKKLKLYEVSVVSIGLNERARVEDVKDALSNGELPSLPEFEKFLREAGFSKTQAAAVASRGLAHLLRSESESQEDRRQKIENVRKLIASI